ncbi:DUF5097 domain-containing protein [Hamiltosporidium magnivora]|uniref:DUF5097 domain-containing protein n=1 Tax=Hamiltosporidium magnivora TaxID=148818 RepID=A0A4Q9KUH1_9MICR|nr:DUF5097 domain-containing protein [Hamiltosporidium magnivora]
MIESISIKKYIAQYFLENSVQPITETVNQIVQTLSANFINDETVFVKSKEMTGRILSSYQGTYIVGLHYENKMETDKILYKDLMRRDQITKNEVMNYLQNITNETPFGRILKPNILSDLSQRNKSNTNNLKKTPQTTEYREQIKKHQSRIRFPKQAINKKSPIPAPQVVEQLKIEKPKRILVDLMNNTDSFFKSLNGKELDICGFKGENVGLLLEIFSFFNFFGDQISVPSFTIEELASSFSEAEYESKIIFLIHSKLLKILVNERKKHGRDCIKTYIEGALDICKIETDAAAPNIGGFKRIQWFSGDMTHSNWKTYIKSFIFDVNEVYGLQKIMSFKEFSLEKRRKSQSMEFSVKDRLLFVKFLIECVIFSNTVRDIVSKVLDKLKSLEKEKYELSVNVRKHRNDFKEIKTEEEKIKMTEKIDEISERLKDLDVEILETRYRADLGSYKGAKFYRIEKKIFYFYESTYYLLDYAGLSMFLRRIKPGNRTETILSSGLRHIQEVLLLAKEN